MNYEILRIKENLTYEEIATITNISIMDAWIIIKGGQTKKDHDIKFKKVMNALNMSVRSIMLLRNKEINYAEIARKIGVSRQAVSAWVNGLSIPTEEHFKILYEELISHGYI